MGNPRLKPFFRSLDLLVESVEDGVGKFAAKDFAMEETVEEEGVVDGIHDYSFPEPQPQETEPADVTDDESGSIWERWNEHCRDHKQRMEARGLPPRLDVFSEEPVEFDGALEEEVEQDSIEEQSDDAQEGCT